MTDTGWIDECVSTLIGTMQHGMQVCQSGITAFGTRQVHERSAMDSALAARDSRRIVELKSLLEDIETEVEGLKSTQNAYAAMKDHVQSAAEGIKSGELGSFEVDPQALDEVKVELKRVRRVFKRLGIEFKIRPGLSPHSIRFVEAVVGLRLDNHTRAMWRLADGSGDDYWFLDGGESDPLWCTPCQFSSLSDSLLKLWSQGCISDESEGPPSDDEEDFGQEFEQYADPEIQPGILQHKLWFPIAQSTGITVLRFDAIPAMSGNYGQLIRFVHDPDSVSLVAKDFISFFRAYNQVLESALQKDVAALRELLLR